VEDIFIFPDKTQHHFIVNMALVPTQSFVALCNGEAPQQRKLAFFKELLRSPQLQFGHYLWWSNARIPRQISGTPSAQVTIMNRYVRYNLPIRFNTGEFLDAHHRSLNQEWEPKVDSYFYQINQQKAMAVIKRFVERHCQRGSASEQVIKMQHANHTCVICYEEQDSLFIKCKICKSGEYHRICMERWCREIYRHKPILLVKKKCLLCHNVL
jgi:hypothetical protein